jgi:hypothetical protein
MLEPGREASQVGGRIEDCHIRQHFFEKRYDRPKERPDESGLYTGMAFFRSPGIPAAGIKSDEIFAN